MTGRDAAGRPPAAAVLAVLLALGACTSIVGPKPIDENWTTHDSAHFRLYTRPGSFGEQNAASLAAALDAQYENTLRVLDLHYAGRITGFLYNSSEDAGEQVYAGRGYFAVESFKAVCDPPLDDALRCLVRHEANHAMAGGALGLPGSTFVSEGLASAVLIDIDPFRGGRETGGLHGPRSLYAWTRANLSNLPPLDALAEDSRWYDYSLTLSYNTSASFVAYLLETFGADKLKALYYANTGVFARRFQEIYGRSLQQAEQDWKQFCSASR